MVGLSSLVGVQQEKFTSAVTPSVWHSLLIALAHTNIRNFSSLSFISSTNSGCPIAACKILSIFADHRASQTEEINAKSGFHFIN